jgi:hypothetical protein
MIETPLQGFARGGAITRGAAGLVYFAPLGLGIVRRPSQAVYPENRSSSGITASQEAHRLGVPSFSNRGRSNRGRDWGQTTKLENPGLGAIFPACSRGDGWDAPTGLRSRGGADYPGRGPGLVYFAPLGLGIVR